MSPLDLRKIVIDAIQEILVPDIQEIKSDIHRLDEKIANQGIQLNQRIDSLDQRIDFLEGNIHTFREEFRHWVNSLERQIEIHREDYKLAVNLHERIAALEARLSAR